MKPAAIEKAVIERLRAVPAGAQTSLGMLRVEIGCTGAELRGTIESMRLRGKLCWDRLELSGSLKASGSEPAGSGPAEFGPAEPEPIARDEEQDSAGARTGAAGGSGERPESAPAGATMPSPDGGGGGEEEATASPPLSTLAGEPTGAQLYAEIAGYLARTGESKTRFGQLVANSPTMVDRLRTARRPRAETVQRVRDFMARHPGGPGAREVVLRSTGSANPASRVHISRANPAKGDVRKAAAVVEAAAEAAPGTDRPLVERVRHEAEVSAARRRLARCTGRAHSGLTPPAPETLVEQLQSMLAETPEDLIRAIHRAHPVLWRRLVLLGRAYGERPAQALYRALETGIEAIETLDVPA